MGTQRTNCDRMRGKVWMYVVLVVCSVAIVLFQSGCETKAQTGGLMGAGIGALAGQAIGGSTGATLLGAGIGGGAGYLIGNEQDKKAAKRYSYDTQTPLTGTKWQMVNLTMENEPPPQYESYFVEFKPNGEMVSTINEPGGTQTITEERYRIVGNTMIISRPSYIVNAVYRVQGNTMTVEVLDDFRAVLRRVQ